MFLPRMYKMAIKADIRIKILPERPECSPLIALHCACNKNMLDSSLEELYTDFVGSIRFCKTGSVLFAGMYAGLFVAGGEYAAGVLIGMGLPVSNWY